MANTPAKRDSVKITVLKAVICLAAAACLVVLDQLSKAWAVDALKGQADLVLIPDVLVFRYLENSGMAFGLFQNAQVFFYIITAVILLVVGYILIRTPVKKRYILLLAVLSVVIAGAVGNLIDRAANRYVVDFIYLICINFPIFNVADCYVTVGCIVLIILLSFVLNEEELRENYVFWGKKKTEAPPKEG